MARTGRRRLLKLKVEKMLDELGVLFAACGKCTEKNRSSLSCNHYATVVTTAYYFKLHEHSLLHDSTERMERLRVRNSAQ